MKLNHQQYNSLTISGVSYDASELGDLCKEKLHSKTLEHWEIAFYQFIEDWLDESPYIVVKTSGSTGSPKQMKAIKLAMLQSALNTIDFFDLKPGDKALLCLPCDFIAGKMMVVRALAGQLNLIPVPVTSCPLSTLDTKTDFAALTPQQMTNELNRTPGHLDLLETVILGGSPVSDALKSKLNPCSFNAWETYGMTETLSHIALKPLNGPKAEEFFTPLKNVRVWRDKRNCLMASVPYISPDAIATNDLVEINKNGKFKITGRYDNIINTGGIKVSPEEVESRIAHLIDQPFYISSVPHAALGQELVLIMPQAPENKDVLLKKLKSVLPPYHAPRKIIEKKLTLTETGKIKRE